MKKHKLSILGISMVLLITSCKKNDVLQPEAAKATAGVQKTSGPSVQWKPVTAWTTTKMENVSLFSSTIEDAAITAAVAGNGLVLVYKKNSAGVNALPFQENGTNNSWYYQVSQNTITINCNSNSGQSLGNSHSFSYFIISSEKINELVKKGHSKIELMQLSYENATALLN
ncbi:MAG: hypothetical protein NVS9B7_07650 [Flavisolibacter sp.]